MALNIKDAETEALAADVAALTGENKTRAINVALRERKARLLVERTARERRQRLLRFLNNEAWPQIPPDLLGTSLIKPERADPWIRPGGRVIVDSSALCAILLREPGWEPLLECLVMANGPVGAGAPTLTETGIVLAARVGPQGKTLLARFTQESGIREVPFTAEHWPVATDAYLRFGRAAIQPR
ncbi:type II toxin-antitoxin system VapB family antitoxin [Luedemannella flava]